MIRPSRLWIVLFPLLVASCTPPAEPPAPSAAVQAFYYAWYGNPEIDGAYRHWNHEVFVRDEPPRAFPGGAEIGANFYPQLGCYSSNDSAVVAAHMRQMRRGGIGVLCLSWWGHDSFSGAAAGGILDAADREGLEVCFHLEPFEGRNVETSREAIVSIIDRYGHHPAFHRARDSGDRPVFYVYDSYLTPASEWATILEPDAAPTIRGTPYDAVVLALWVGERDGAFVLEGSFDGFYTYFATDGFTYGSTAAHWPILTAWAREHEKIAVLCLGPGYCDTRIRPWNERNYRSREAGAYYDRLFAAALAAQPTWIGITSFNEWHEGTQIEPAVPMRVGDFVYEDYAPLAPDAYLARTARWVERFERRRAASETR
ncbi:MAG: alpha-mannosidase [Candidatus Eisenbacteria bacterium]|nr:alpha-mannosidase [Candidatus Eisenbacteria bacterium]